MAGLQDVVDADFIVIGRAAETEATPQPAKASPAVTSARQVLSRSLAALARLLEGRLQMLSGRHFATLVASLSALVFAAVAAYGLGTADHPEIAARPLDFVHVNLTPQDRNGMRVLLVNAIVENRSSQRLEVPPIRADLLVDGQVVASTHIAPPAGQIEAGHSRGLAARLQHPGGKTPELRLSFDDTGA